MDTTPEYIKQSEKATEIQKLRIPKKMNKDGSTYFPFEDGDFAFEGKNVITMGGDGYDIVSYVWDTKRRLEVSSAGYREGDGYTITKIVWLPRQDQLQEIWRREYLKRPSKHGWFGEFCNFIDAPYSDGASADESFDSMEQIWLAFVMKEKYGKVWNGEEWEVDN